VGCVPKRLRSYIYCCHVKAFTHMQAQEKVEKVGRSTNYSFSNFAQ
jgi:hypothetical protein